MTNNFKPFVFGVAFLGVTVVASARGTWSTTETSPDIRGKSLQIQRVASDTTINLGFPYQGPQPIEIMLRSDAQAIVAVAKGQVNCGDYRETIAARFDGGKVQNYSCDRSADGSSNLVFLRNAKRFADQARRAKKIELEVPFYRNGRQLVAFNIASPLASAPAKPTAASAANPQAPTNRSSAKPQTGSEQSKANNDARALAGSSPLAPSTSSTYAPRVRSAIRPNITYADIGSSKGNPSAEFQVTLAPDGTITSLRLTKSSGVASWDEAAEQGIRRTGKLPRDVGGTVPPRVTIALAPKD